MRVCVYHFAQWPVLGMADGRRAKINGNWTYPRMRKFRINFVYIELWWRSAFYKLTYHSQCCSYMFKNWKTVLKPPKIPLEGWKNTNSQAAHDRATVATTTTKALELSWCCIWMAACDVAYAEWLFWLPVYCVSFEKFVFCGKPIARVSSFITNT